MHGITTIEAINARNVDAARSLSAHDPAGSLARRWSEPDRQGGGVQPWSVGARYPGVIHVTHDDLGCPRYHASLGTESCAPQPTWQLAEAWIIERKAARAGASRAAAYAA